MLFCVKKRTFLNDCISIKKDNPAYRIVIDTVFPGIIKLMRCLSVKQVILIQQYSEESSLRNLLNCGMDWTNRFHDARFDYARGDSVP